MPILERCPYFRGVHSERFHCIALYSSLFISIVMVIIRLFPQYSRYQFQMSVVSIIGVFTRIE